MAGRLVAVRSPRNEAGERLVGDGRGADPVQVATVAWH